MTILLETSSSNLVLDKANNEILNYFDFISQLEIPRHHKIVVFSKLVQPNRYSAFYSDESQGYAFSGKKANSLPLTEELRCLLNLVNETYDENYNGILINKYVTTQDQHDYIGSHSDDERGLGKNGVLSISFGITRKFRIRDKKTKRIVLDIDLNHGDICIMKGFFQKEFTHEIPVEKKRLGTRWSLTFRHHSV